MNKLFSNFFSSSSKQNTQQSSQLKQTQSCSLSYELIYAFESFNEIPFFSETILKWTIFQLDVDKRKKLKEFFTSDTTKDFKEKKFKEK